jgi:cytochrome b561
MRRASHALLASMVLLQMLVSEWMSKPWKTGPADTPGRLLYAVHEWAGVAAATALAFIVWHIVRRGELPRTDAAARSVLLAQWRTLATGLISGRPPLAGETAALAHVVHMLGLLLTAWFCVSGAAIWLVGDASETAHRIGELHELTVPLLYAYVGGHIGMALLHRYFHRTH